MNQENSIVIHRLTYYVFLFCLFVFFCLAVLFIVSRSDAGISKVDRRWMSQALRVARKGAEAGNFPVGAIVVSDGKVIGKGFNTAHSDQDPSRHAEVNAIADAAQSLGIPHFHGYPTPVTLYTTKEPCALCRGYIARVGVSRVIAGSRLTLLEFLEDGLRWLHYFSRLRSGVSEAEQEELERSFQSKLKEKVEQETSSENASQQKDETPS